MRGNGIVLNRGLSSVWNVAHQRCLGCLRLPLCSECSVSGKSFFALLQKTSSFTRPFVSGMQTALGDKPG
jgi:hypothetical protein